MNPVETAAAIPMTRRQLTQVWQERMESFLRWGVTLPGAVLVRDFLADLERLWADEDLTWLPGREAAKVSGYSEDHLRRMARSGTEVVAKKRGRAWQYLAGSLPVGHRPSGVLEFDPSAAARRSLLRKSAKPVREGKCP